MNKTAILLALVVPLVIGAILYWLGKQWDGAAKYSEKEAAAMRNIKYPSWYVFIPILWFTFFALIIIFTILFAIKTSNTGLVPGLMRSLFAPDAIFFNPGPGFWVLSLTPVTIIFFGGLLLLNCWILLLPAKMQAYAAGQGRASRLSPKGAAKAGWKLVSVVYAVVLIGTLVVLPLYSSVNQAGIDHISTYPLHTNTPFSQVQVVDVNCHVNYSSDYGPDVDIRIVARSDGNEITIFSSTSDYHLPYPGITAEAISDMYKVFENNNVTIVKNPNPDCAVEATDLTNPQAKTQYDAFFGNGEQE